MNKNIVGAMIASSLVLANLAGCATPNPANGAVAPGGTTTVTKPNTGTTGSTNQPTVTTQPGQTGSTATAPSSNDTSTEAASAMADERDMDNYGAMADQEDPAPATYSALAVDAAASGTATATTTAGADLKAAAAKVKAGQKLSADEKRAAVKAAAKIKITVEVKAKVQARIKERNQKIAKRLDKLANQRGKMRDQLKNVKWVDNGDGTETKTISFDDSRTVNGKTATRKATITRTRQTDTKALVSWHAEFDQMLPGGLHRVSTRDKVLQEDGSYLVTFHSELTLAGGAKRTSDWTKTIGADGMVTGSGTITWTGKNGETQKTKTVTLSGDEDAPKCAEDGGKAAVTLPADGDATVTTDAGTTATVPADSAAVDASADATATTTTTDTGASATADATATTSAST